MIAELVRQYDTLKSCNIVVPDPYFDNLEVWAEIVLKSDGSFRRVNWLGKPKDSQNRKKTAKEEPTSDVNCPVTEKSACRSSGNDSPRGLVDNAMWIFGKFAKEKQKQKSQANQKSKSKQKEGKTPPDEARRQAYLNQLKAFYDHNPAVLAEIKTVYDCLSCKAIRNELWNAVEQEFKTRIIDGKGVKLFENDKSKWQAIAAKMNIRWVVERTGESGKPVNALESVRKEWKAFQQANNEWHIVSLIDGQRKPARILHPRIKGASLISFNNVATYCGHLSTEYRGKPDKRKEEQRGGDQEDTCGDSGQNTRHGNEKEETDGSALPAQVGFEEAEKYSKVLEWLVDNSSVRFGGDSVNCIWIDQRQLNDHQLDQSAHEFVKPQYEESIFTRGKARGGKGQVLADSGDLLKALERFRNGQEAGYRDKRFYLLSLLLRRKGRHAILGSYVGTMGLLDDSAGKFVSHTKIGIPPRYLARKDEAREFCPSLLDILSAAGIKSEKKLRLVWDREVIEVIVAGRSLPVDLCRLVVQKAVRDKHLERSEKKRSEYLALLATAAGCARHYLTAIRKEGYGMGLDPNVTDTGYLTGRLFALCENIQKRGRSWGPTLSDKLFSAAIDMPRQTVVQLYRNCLCYDVYKADREWFAEIFDKMRLDDGACGPGEVVPENGVDPFAFMLGYWHQRGELAKDK